MERRTRDVSGPIHNLLWLGDDIGTLTMRTQAEETMATCSARARTAGRFLGSQSQSSLRRCGAVVGLARTPNSQTDRPDVALMHDETIIPPQPRVKVCEGAAFQHDTHVKAPYRECPRDELLHTQLNEGVDLTWDTAPL